MTVLGRILDGNNASIVDGENRMAGLIGTVEQVKIYTGKDVLYEAAAATT